MKRLMVWLGVVVLVAFSQDIQERFRERSRQSEKEGLKDPFRGVTAKGVVEPGLFAVKHTGVSTEPVRKAAEAFLKGLTPEQRAKSVFPVDDPEWRKWMNQHFYVRQGVSFLEMNEKQRELGFALLRASLSADGLKLSRDIMKLNETLGEMNNNNFVEYGEWRYHITVMGEPSKDKPWGWQIDGHHLIINYFVLGDQVVMTPTFVGSEPVIATMGKYKGTSILQEEPKMGLALIRSLDDGQKAKTVLTSTKTENNNVGEAFKDNVVLDYAGLQASAMNPAQRKALLALVAKYIGNMDEGHAKVKMAEVEKYLDRTWFAWIGGTQDDSVFYYRIHSPVILIEFDHQRPAGLRAIMKDQMPNKEHVHVVIRTPNGNDYGKDLLRQHYAMYKH